RASCCSRSTGEETTMELLVERDVFTEVSTAGALYFDGQAERECFTLELPNHHGCIDEGRYEVVPYQSPHFHCIVPLLVAVPRHPMIEMHPGRTARDTKGCLLLGKDRLLPDRIGRPVPAFDAVMAKLGPTVGHGLTLAWANGRVWVTVRNKPSAPVGAAA